MRGMVWHPEERVDRPDWSAPTDLNRPAVERVLAMLAGRNTHPEMAALWARGWDLDSVEDPVVSWGLDRVLRCNTRLTAHEYLHSVADYRAWFDEYEEMLGAST